VASSLEKHPKLFEWVFGYWHDRAEAGPGQMTLLIQHPGEQSLKPARAEEIIRPLHPKP